MDYLGISTRMLVVLISSTVGLIGGSLIHYIFLEDTLVLKGSRHSVRWGNLLFLLSVGVFLLAVYVLYLNRMSSVLVALLGMFLTKLCWNVGDSLRYAGRLYAVVESLNEETSSVDRFLDEVRTYRQVQDLRTLAQTRYLPGSQQLRQLEKRIEAHAEASGSRPIR